MWRVSKALILDDFKFLIRLVEGVLEVAALTALFTLLVNLCMGKKLRSIDMVESLKAPE